MSATPPASPGLSGYPAAACAPTTPKKVRPKKNTASPKKTPSPKKMGTTASPACSGSSSFSSTQKLTPGLKQAAIALKMRGDSVKKIAEQLNVNYHTVWKHIDRIMKAKDKIGTDGRAPEDMSDADKKDAATALKISGFSVKEIAAVLDINYHTVWKHLDRQQKAAGLPPPLRDSDL